MEPNLIVSGLATEGVAWLAGVFLFVAVAVAERNELLTRERAAEYIGISAATLACWACTKRYGLPFLKVGRLVRYRKSDLDKWLESRTQGAEAK